MGDIAIRVENLSKYYKLGVINSGTLSRDLQSWLWKRLGKEDPNKRIGAEEGNLAGFWALKDLNFEIKKGDRVGIIGKNGAGKSTLLKMISQISAPTEGKIYIDGKIASLLEVGTGFNPELTGRENIYLNGAILGMKKKEVDRKLDEIIAFSEIERHIDTPVKRYSSGMYVRLAFAVAAHLESDILIADEVLAVGDAAFQKKALGKMNELSTGQGRTVLFVSHNISQVKSLCSKGIVLHKGQVVRIDDDISESIDWYMGTDDSGMSSRKKLQWINDGEFKHQELCPLRIEFIDDTNRVVSGTLNYGENYRLRLVVEVINSFDSPINFCFNFYRGGENIISCGLPDGSVYSNGVHVYDFKISQGMLLPGKYMVSPVSSIKNAAWIIPPESSIMLPFEVTLPASMVNMFRGFEVNPAELM